MTKCPLDDLKDDNGSVIFVLNDDNNYQSTDQDMKDTQQLGARDDRT